MTAYPKRLIEVDLPIRRISAHARREKSIRHGHISTLHIWWARRPLAACRAVICAALWPDPADPLCPEAFRGAARTEMQKWVTHERQAMLSKESQQRFEKARQKTELFNDVVELRGALLDFIADFANWDNSTVREYLDTSRALTQAAHEALGGAPGTRPLVVDPFAGGGSIPLEALRVGADAFASDLNPVPVLLNKVVLEYIPRYGQRLADEVRKWGEWIKREAERELAEFYPKDEDGAQPVAYLWARTIRCEGPGCGATVPIFTNDVLARRKTGDVRLKIAVTQSNIIETTVSVGGKPEGTTKTAYRSSVLCPVCDFTTPAEHVRRQFNGRHGGNADGHLLAVVTSKPGQTQRSYRQANSRDKIAFQKACARLEELPKTTEGLSTIPDERLPYLRSIFNINLLDVNHWRDLFTPRQALLLTTFTRLVRELHKKDDSRELGEALSTCLAIAVNKMADFHSTLCAWINVGEKVGHTFGRQALGIIWDFTEANPFANISGAWSRCTEYIAEFIEANASLRDSGQAVKASATSQPLPDDSAHAFVTDPPYYDAVPYANLSDYFYVWFKRSLRESHRELFMDDLSPKNDEIVQLAERNPIYAFKTREYFESNMMKAMAESRRVLSPSGIGLVVFAHKTTAGWETQLQAMMDANWCVTASWPIDTERPGRLRAMGSAALASSVHLVCRPRENSDGSVRTDDIGDWRDVLQELPRRIHEWMPRLAEEGVVGADAIFACLGPALEIFSRYSRVEKASGEAVTLKEYLEQVWSAVAKEALALVFKDADTTGFEADARLTAMWLWTLNAGSSSAEAGGESEDGADDEEESEAKGGKAKGGFALEYDAARKIAQGLGAHLEDLGSLVEVSGEQARLLPVGERARHLFGKDEGKMVATRKKKEPQLDLFKVMEQSGEGGTTFGEPKVERHGETVLDRIHQSMILFAAGRGEALKRFLVEDGVGKDQRFWRLAQALSALYPSHTEEKRWVDGVLARKKGLGF